MHKLRHYPPAPFSEIHWNPTEHWVWRKLSTGESADFNERYGLCPLSWVEGAWPKEEKARRRIRPQFLYTILLHEPWREALSDRGVRLVGAYLAGPVDMPHAVVRHEFCLIDCYLEGGLNLFDARFTHRVDIYACCVNE